MRENDGKVKSPSESQPYYSGYFFSQNRYLSVCENNNNNNSSNIIIIIIIFLSLHKAQTSDVVKSMNKKDWRIVYFETSHIDHVIFL